MLSFIPAIFYISYGTIYSAYVEKRADLKAVEILDDNKSAIHTFTRFMQNNIYIKNNGKSNWRDNFISDNGDYYLDFQHPFLSTRLNYVKKIDKY